MKKFILLAAIAASFTSMKAESFSDFFKLSWNGETIENGQTITVKDYEDPNHEIGSMIPGYVPSYNAAARIIAENVNEEPWLLEFKLSRTAPSLEDYPVMGSEIGSYQLCFSYLNEEGKEETGNCLAPSDENVLVSGSQVKEIDPETSLIMDIDQMQFTSLTPVSFRLDLYVTEGGETVEGGTATIYIDMTHEIDLGSVNTIVTDSSSEYYTIQGLRVSEPVKGNIYIVRKGSSVSKIIF